jgi:hypothetical protein
MATFLRLKRFLPISSTEVWTSLSTSVTVSGPLWPRETAELLRQLNWQTVRGNHDRWVTDWPPEKHYPSDAIAFQALDSSQLAWLRALPQTRELPISKLALDVRRLWLAVSLGTV